jgi:long-chain acyl-CoA synthetase
MYARVMEGLQNKPPYLKDVFHLAVNVGWDYLNYKQGRTKSRASVVLWPLLKRLIADKICEKLGGRLRIAISGGAALAPEISRVFVGLGVPILQGYGLTEASPVVSVNRLESNIPASIGSALPGVEVKLSEEDELLVRGDSVMLGYWKDESATEQAINSEGWLYTGDKAKIENDFIYITGRLKDIIVLSTGEKVPPHDMELAIATDHLFEQIMVIGESRPYLTALAVLNKEQLDKLLETEFEINEPVTEEKIEKLLQSRIEKKLKTFPGYAQIRRIAYVNEHWSVENGLLTPTLKIKRNKIQEKYATEIGIMYTGNA